jgi:hypothetical protein
MPGKNLFVNDISQSHKLTKIDNGCPGQCMSQAKHNDDQTEGRIYHSHDSALLVEAAHIPQAR